MNLSIKQYWHHPISLFLVFLLAHAISFAQYIGTLFLLGFSANIFGQSQIHIKPKAAFVKNGLLRDYYPLDSIKAIVIGNWKPEHKLAGKKKAAFIFMLRHAYYSNAGAHTKPGHIYARIIFLSGSILPFYSNSEGEIIILADKGEQTFLPAVKINYDNY